VTNNFCEYNGLIRLLEWAATEGITGMTIYSDSELVINQTNRVWRVKHGLEALRDRASSLMVAGKHSLQWERGHSGNVGNERADQLCNIVLDSNGVKAPYARGKKKKA
jgi:ribonuclease HI